MCEGAVRRDRGVGWWSLAWAVVPPLLGLFAVARAARRDAAAALLQAGLVVVLFAGMALWIRRQRVALDLQGWCACAAAVESPAGTRHEGLAARVR
jgi:hypothetical protein